MNRRYLFLPTLLALLLLSFMPTQAQDLNVYLSASNHVAGPGERIIYSITVTNTGPVNLFNVVVPVQLPDHIDNFNPPPGWFCGINNDTPCSPNERDPSLPPVAGYLPSLPPVAGYLADFF